jgi:hypothetical protein
LKDEEINNIKGDEKPDESIPEEKSPEKSNLTK